MRKCIGVSIMRRQYGFEPVIVFDDLSYQFIYPDDGPFSGLSSAAAISRGRILARSHKLPFRASLYQFKYLIKEAIANA